MPLTARLNDYEVWLSCCSCPLTCLQAAVYGDSGKAPKIVEFPPPIEAVACKPVLFDLALNKVRTQGLEREEGRQRRGEGRGGETEQRRGGREEERRWGWGNLREEEGDVLERCKKKAGGERRVKAKGRARRARGCRKKRGRAGGGGGN
eukprot:747949-Hanusia_phi.AAC.3